MVSLKERIITFFKGLWIGGSLSVPGVSGGSMAMILGIYDKLIFSLNSLFKPNKDKKINKKENFLFLCEAGIGGIVGILTLYKLIEFLMNTFGLQMSFFFIGTVAGGVPLIFKAAKVDKIRFSDIAWMAVGMAAVIGLLFLPEGLFVGGNFAIQILGGVIAAAALVLPGISVSQMLLTMGLYEFIFGAATSFSIDSLISLIPFGIGLVIGVVCTSGGMEFLMKKYNRQTYLAVLGFVVGSVGGLVKDVLGRIVIGKGNDEAGEYFKNIFGDQIKYEAEDKQQIICRNLEQLSENGFIVKEDINASVWVVCALLVVAGFIAVYTLSLAEDKKASENDEK